MHAAPITPVPTPTSQPFWDALADGRVTIQRCQQCETWVYYPRARCSHCLSDSLEWTEVSGVGTVYTFTVARQPTTPAFAEVVDPIIAVVELDEGVRVTSSLEGVEPADVRVGMRVRPLFAPAEDGVWILRHQPAD
ncbi:MAG: Zn-ribbon domain-containing OB-fold protein [Acidimicrobiales bacterium]